jgi:hypothetical protein
MSDEMVSAGEAARRLGIAVTSLYDWLGQSDRGILVVRGQAVTINYFQTGPQGQGRIHLEQGEVDRLKDLLRVRPQPAMNRRPPVRRDTFPGISVSLGRPDKS